MQKVEAEQGFFRNYYNKVKSSLNDDQLKHFEALQTDKERFIFVFKLKPENELILHHNDSEKNYDCAITLKNQGNKAFQEENYKKAWKLYSDSALRVPWQSECKSELSVIIANRAAALYHLQEYDSALDDIEFSLKLGYPSELHFKIADRKARCLLGKKQLKDALVAFRETLQALDNAKLSKERKQKWQLDVQIMLSMLGKNPHLSNAPVDRKEIKLPELQNVHSSYKSASIAVKIDQSPSMGRYAVASQNINVGEPLVVEPPYCSVLLSEHAKTHCFHCFSRLRNPVPCMTCSAVSFCSQKCQDTALKTHHKIECSILTALWKSGASITCLMALRILSQSNLDYFLSVRPRLGENRKYYHNYIYTDMWRSHSTLISEQAKGQSYCLLRATLLECTTELWGIVMCGTYETMILVSLWKLDGRHRCWNSVERKIPRVHKSGDYLDVYSLVTHEEKRSTEDLFHRTNMAVFLFECLRSGGYFGKEPSHPGDDLTESEAFIGGLILHHLQLLQFNAHEISELVMAKDEDVDSGRSIFLGGGLYPTLALFNHSCDPGVTRYFIGTSVIVRAAKNISMGDMVAENYGPIFTQMIRSERQNSLKTQYWFDCTCVPCEDNWPRFEEMDAGILRFKCNGESNQNCKQVLEVSTNSMDFMIKCSECNQHTNILKVLKALQDTESLFKRAKSLMVKREFTAALETFCDLLNRLDETLAPPFRDYHLCQQGIRRCMLFLGNIYQQS